MRTLFVTSTILSMIWTLGDFNSVYLLTGGGPADLTHVLATLGIRYLRLDQVDMAMASIVVALPFVLPLVVIFALSYYGLTSEALTTFQKRHTGWVRLGTALLFLTQPALSRSIRALEDELGQALFDRVGRHLALNEDGRALLPGALALLDQATKEPDGAKRAELLHQAEALMLSETAVLPLLTRVTQDIVSPKITGYADNAEDIHRTRYMCRVK